MVRLNHDKIADFRRLLFVMSLIACGLSNPILGQGVDAPIVPEKRIFILQDLVDDFNFGLNAGGQLKGFGGVLGEFILVENAGNGLNLMAISGLDTAVRLATVDDGFGTGPGERFILFQKTFADTTVVDPNDPDKKVIGNTIDASNFSAIAYWIKNDASSGSNASVKIELLIGDGGVQDSREGSTWTQFNPTDLSGLTPSTGHNGFSQIVVNLTGIHSGTQGGFERTVAPAAGNPPQNELNAELLKTISAVNIILSGDGNDSKEAILVDDIVFISPPFNLSIGSRPFSRVELSGDVNKSTPIIESGFLGVGEEKMVCAPLTQTSEGSQFIFDEWILDGASMAGVADTDNNRNCLTLTLFQNSSLVANYLASTVSLEIKSTPIEGISISGTNPTEPTNFSTTVDVGSEVALNAPFKQADGNQTFHFLRWKTEEAGQQAEIHPERQNSISFTVQSNTTATAEYGAGEVLLTVTSIPVNGIAIGGNQAGTTDYVMPLNKDAEVDLTAPATHTFSGVDLEFKQWLVIVDDVVDSTSSNESLSIAITDETTVVAVYDPVWKLSAGWNLISTPIPVDNTAAQTDLFSQADGLIWFWQQESQRYEVTDLIEVGKGYWVYSDQSEGPIKISGTSTSSRIPVATGWNLTGVIGNQVVPDSTGLSAFNPQPGAGSVVWTWDSEHQKLTNIDGKDLQLFKQNALFPGLGYWVFLKQLDQQ